MKAKKPRRLASKKTAARTTPSSKPKMGQKASVALNQAQADQDIEIDWKGLVGFFDRNYADCEPICLFPGDVQGGFSFMDCLPQIGDCGMLIFCELKRSLEDIQTEIRGLVEGGEIGVEAPCYMNLPIPEERGQLFPNCEIAPPAWVPYHARPPLERFWGHYCVVPYHTVYRKCL